MILAHHAVVVSSMKTIYETLMDTGIATQITAHYSMEGKSAFVNKKFTSIILVQCLQTKLSGPSSCSF